MEGGGHQNSLLQYLRYIKWIEPAGGRRIKRVVLWVGVRRRVFFFSLLLASCNFLWAIKTTTTHTRKEKDFDAVKTHHDLSEPRRRRVRDVGSSPRWFSSSSTTTTTTPNSSINYVGFKPVVACCREHNQLLEFLSLSLSLSHTRQDKGRALCCSVCT